MKYTIFCLSLFLFFSCAKSTEQTTSGDTGDTQEQSTPPPADPPPAPETPAVEERAPGTFQKSLTDGKITFNVAADNGENTSIVITADGLERKDYRHEFKVEGQLMEAHMLDLNKDGFAELYLIVRGTDDSGNMMIKGLASYRNKSAGEIYVKDTDIIRQMNSDRVYVEDQKLMRSLVDEKGEAITYTYELKKGETSFVLEPK